MRFIYEYRTHENVVRRGEIAASDREAAFRALKERGIRPGWLGEAPGFFNKLFGKGKRWIAIGVLCVLCLVLGVVTVRTKQESRIPQSAPRHQIYGDPVIVATFEDAATLLDICHSNRGDVVLAAYAQPGKLVPSVLRMKEPVAERLAESLEAVLPVEETDSREIAELKQIVNWMREELRAYVYDGGERDKKLKSYAMRLNQRYFEEKQIYDRVARELEGITDEKAWDEKNAALRRIGLRTIPMPEPAE